MSFLSSALNFISEDRQAPRLLMHTCFSFLKRLDEYLFFENI